MFDKPFQQFKPVHERNSPLTAIANQESYFYTAHADKTIYQYSKEKLQLITTIPSAHSHKITALHEKQNLLITAAYDGIVKLYDIKTNYKPVHQFKKIGSKFNAIDVSEHILVAAHNNKLVFWDLRKMKQRMEFNDSFHDEITSVQFDSQNPTILMGCSMDGLIDKFDLSQPNEEEAFVWGHKIIESPVKLQFHQNTTLIQTANHALVLLEEESLKLKYDNINSADQPTHIMHSELTPDGHIAYCTYQLKNQIIQYKIDSFTKTYFQTSSPVDALLPLSKHHVVYFDAQGSLYSIKGTAGHCPPQFQTQQIKQNKELFMVVEDQSKDKHQKSSKNTEDNGYLVKKLKSLIAKSNKFEPY